MDPAPPMPEGSNQQPPVHFRTTTTKTSDGREIGIECAIPDVVTTLAVLCHPHPLYGGTSTHPLLLMLESHLNAIGCATARFNFRHSSGNTIDEMPDARAALDVLDAMTPSVPRVLIGYSFGAIVALRVALSLQQSELPVDSVVLVAPPLVGVHLEPPTTSTTIIAMEHDQFCPPSELSSHPLAAQSHVITVTGADHFLHGALNRICSEAVETVTTLLDG